MSTRAPVWAPASGVVLATVLIACGPKSDAVEHYETRGIITAIIRDPDETVVTLHHEAIPAFRDRDGKASRMDSMKMNFSLGRDPASELAQGDKVAVDFEVHWSGGPPLRITRRQKLPANTSLTLSDEH